MMPLIEMAIRQAKPAPRAIKMFDERGLFLLVQPTGSRYWRFKYRIDGKEKLLALGVYPDVPLKLARERREEARRLVADGIDPSAKRQAPVGKNCPIAALLASDFSKPSGLRTLPRACIAPISSKIA